MSTNESDASGSLQPGNGGACPMCGGALDANTRRCRSCGEQLPSANPTKMRRILLRATEWLVVCAIIAVLLALVLSPATSGVRGARRWRCKNNLKQIGIALHNYHEKYGCFPPAYVADEKGRPMHSWRFLLLPFLEQQQLYDECRLDEPWNGPHNSRLSERTLDVFNCPDENHEKGRKSTTMTSYVAVVGPETAWPTEKPTKIGDITDGTSRTLLIVEVANSGIHWMEPRDLHVLQMAPTINSKSGQGISSVHLLGAQVLFADGSVRFLPDALPAATLRALLTRDGGETVGNF